MYAAVDDADNLIVGDGETYTLGGVHSYNVDIQIEGGGVLYVASYDGSADTGWLELHAPSITVVGTINGDYRGCRTAEGSGSGYYSVTGHLRLVELDMCGLRNEGWKKNGLFCRMGHDESLSLRCSCLW